MSTAPCVERPEGLMALNRAPDVSESGENEGGSPRRSGKSQLVHGVRSVRAEPGTAQVAQSLYAPIRIAIPASMMPNPRLRIGLDSGPTRDTCRDQ